MHTAQDQQGPSTAQNGDSQRACDVVQSDQTGGNAVADVSTDGAADAQLQRQDDEHGGQRHADDLQSVRGVLAEELLNVGAQPDGQEDGEHGRGVSLHRSRDAVDAEGAAGHTHQRGVDEDGTEEHTHQRGHAEAFCGGVADDNRA